MSVSLVKRSLDLVSVVSHSSKKTPVEYQQGRKHRLKFKKIASSDPKKNAAVIVQKLRENSKGNTGQNKVEINVQKLLKLSKDNVAHTNKEKKRMRKLTKSKNGCSKSEEKKKPSAFTEEDFAKFEKEFFAN